MIQQDIFLLADADLRSVIDRIQPAQFLLPAPAEWSRTLNPTVRDIVHGHAYDEAWVPDVLAGKTIDEVGDAYAGDLLGDDPIASYDRFNDLATDAALKPLDPDQVAHLSYGDYPISTYLEHVSYYRAFQSWSIAHFLGMEFAMKPELIDGLWELVVPQLDDLRAIGVFAPEVEVPADADRQTQLLGKTGFWIA